mmetsp:Transcript_13911/g.32607  ORF Transcript_13911/g.32607 Transcript_13911/m.32607 type:complete len:286 (+) Transcript_13911:51-908(+)
MPWSKRPADANICQPAPKMPRDTEDGLAEGEWICQACGNLNHAGRMVCNLRKCGAPKPEERWTCFCGNENYAGRLFCNLRKCGMLKPGLKLQDLSKLLAQVGAPGENGQVPGSGPPQRSALNAPAGSWKCIVCGNVNYPTRDVCNGRNGQCAQPRAVVDGGPPESPGRASPTTPSAAPFTASMPTPKATGGSGNAPPGSWVCRLCMNVNFPTRTTCNGHGCGQPRDEVDAGPPGGMAFQPSSPGGLGATDDSAPPGSWKCVACGNINWPGRTACNRRSCGLPRAT